MSHLTRIIIVCILSLLASCARPVSPPALASWPDQRAAVESALKDIGDDFVLVSGMAMPVRSQQGAPGEPVELKVTLLFVSPKSSKVNAQGDPVYPAAMIDYNDHRLAETLQVDSEFYRNEPPGPAHLQQAALLKIGPQDVLQLTIEEGEAFMGKPVDNGNISISLWNASDRPSGLEDTLGVWGITFYREGGKRLSIWVDAQTGDILMRSEN